jgi:hypothetical protein
VVGHKIEKTLDILGALELKMASCQGKMIVNDIMDLKKTPISDNLISLL